MRGRQPFKSLKSAEKHAQWEAETREKQQLHLQLVKLYEKYPHNALYEKPVADTNFQPLVFYYILNWKSYHVIN